MKILGQLLIAFIGGIIAILLYRGFENRNNPYRSEYSLNAPFSTHYGKKVGLTSKSADSINNVFSIGFGATAERTLFQVVHIRSRIATHVPDPLREFFGDGFWEQQQRDKRWEQQFQEASGSGVIVSKDGFIVTNNHVIDNAQEIIVSLFNGGDYKASVVGTDPSTDLAVLKIKEKNLAFATIANSDKVHVGDWVLAVGNPFNLSSTVTAGIVSAKARNIHILKDNSAIESFIQTDAAVNPGNSGGALVNLNGELIGINTAIATPTGTFAGYAFAVPSNIVRKVIDDIIRFGSVQRGYLGVIVRDLTWSLAQEMGLNITQGVVVDNLVPNGAADRAGIKIRDVILAIDGTSVNSVAELLETIAEHRPGDVLRISTQRNGKEILLEVKLQAADKTREISRR